MSDLISRQEAIEAIDAVFPVDPMKSVHAQGIALGAALAKTYIEQLPSAHPTQNERVNSNDSLDYISRQAAIDALDKRFDSIPMEQTTEILLLRKDLRKLPSAQPEIIRCKDCVYWVSHDKRCVYLNHGFAPNMWCCHAERRTDG